MRTNFDRYLDAQMQDPSFAVLFAQASAAWEGAVKAAAAPRRVRSAPRTKATRCGLRNPAEDRR